METLEDRRLLATFSEFNDRLNIDLDKEGRELSIASVLSAAVGLRDVTSPGDTIKEVGGKSNNAAEDVKHAIDGNASTKYTNKGGRGSGFEVTPGVGATIVTGLRLTTANWDVRDPTSFKLEGKSGDGDFTIIAQGGLSLPRKHGSTSTIQFENTTAYTRYRLTFPTLRDANQKAHIAEVEFLGEETDSASVTGTDVTQRGDTTKSVGTPVLTAWSKPEHTIDGNNDTVFRVKGGFDVAPSAGSTLVTGLRVTTSQPDNRFDPTGYELKGKLSSGSYEPIAKGDISIPDSSFFNTATVTFSNSKVYSEYRLEFTSDDSAGEVQLAEVELLGTAVPKTDVLAKRDEVRSVGEPLDASWSQPRFTADNNRDTVFRVKGGFEVAPSAG